MPIYVWVLVPVKISKLLFNILFVAGYIQLCSICQIFKSMVGKIRKYIQKKSEPIIE